MDFLRLIEKREKVNTENGAVGYKTSSSYLLDLNFMVSSFRNSVNTDLLEKSLRENTALTLKWLLYLRDVRFGIGERKSFREFFLYICNTKKDLAVEFLKNVNIAEFGRYDDYVWLYMHTKSEAVRSVIADILKNTLTNDIANMYNKNKSITLLAKWLPSVNTSSREARVCASILCKDVFKTTEKEYRKMLSSLRKRLDVVEVKISNDDWANVNYSAVPSKANLIYKDAFMSHDNARYMAYLNDVTSGNSKINANALFLHEIVASYRVLDNMRFYGCTEEELEVDYTLENLWGAQGVAHGFNNTLVVRDGSGSMTCHIPRTTTTALDVATAITIYCAESNTGFFHNKFLTFSDKTKVVDLTGKETLLDKLKYIVKFDSCMNTNIEDVFITVLTTAKKNKLSQEDLPKSILIISDMEFDCISSDSTETLFEFLQMKFSAAGYRMPKLIFWNVNSRSNVVPITENEDGVVLLSGFSKNLMELVMSSELHPYEALVKLLNSKRYSCIDKIDVDRFLNV